MRQLFQASHCSWKINLPIPSVDLATVFVWRGKMCYLSILALGYVST